MNNFNKGGQGFRGGRGKKRTFGGGNMRNGDRPEMHKVICDECGKNCEVPFRPSSDKPVFCSFCFGKQNDDQSSDRGSRSSADRNSKPSYNDKPSYQKNASPKTDDYKARLDELNLKMDKVLKMLSSIASKETEK